MSPGPPEYKCFACVYLCTVNMSYPGRSEEGIRSSELKLCTVFSCHMDTGNGTWVLGRSNSALNHWASVQPIPQRGDSWVLYYFHHCCVEIPRKISFGKAERVVSVSCWFTAIHQNKKGGVAQDVCNQEVGRDEC